MNRKIELQEASNLLHKRSGRKLESQRPDSTNQKPYESLVARHTYIETRLVLDQKHIFIFSEDT